MLITVKLHLDSGLISTYYPTQDDQYDKRYIRISPSAEQVFFISIQQAENAEKAIEISRQFRRGYIASTDGNLAVFESEYVGNMTYEELGAHCDRIGIKTWRAKELE